MKDEDTRNLTIAELAILRKRAVAAVVEKGETQVRVAELFDINPSTLCEWVKAFAERGEASLIYQKRGPKSPQGALTPEQGEAIVNLMTHKMPEELGLPFFLWTRSAVVELIEKEYGTRVSQQCAGQYLARWNMTPQKPARRATQQDPEAVRIWLESTYPRLKAEAKAKGGIILWLDEMGIRSDDQVGRTYGLRGKTPTVRVSGARFRCNMISAIANNGALHFKLFTENFRVPVYLDFLGRLIEQIPQPITLICDGHAVHHAKTVLAWLETHKDRITQEFLPPYSPELNPDELLNQHAKSGMARKKRSTDKDGLFANLNELLTGIQRTTHIVCNYFKGVFVKYAANV